jgi:hypothetical protein
MSREEVRALERLDPSRLDEREYIALTWVRASLTSPEGAPPEMEEKFMRTFSPRERKYIIASTKGMYFFNLVGNTMDDWVRRAMRRPAYRPKTDCPL